MYDKFGIGPKKIHSKKESVEEKYITNTKKDKSKSEISLSHNFFLSSLVFYSKSNLKLKRIVINNITMSSISLFPYAFFISFPYIRTRLGNSDRMMIQVQTTA